MTPTTRELKEKIEKETKTKQDIYLDYRSMTHTKVFEEKWTPYSLVQSLIQKIDELEENAKLMNSIIIKSDKRNKELEKENKAFKSELGQQVLKKLNNSLEVTQLKKQLFEINNKDFVKNYYKMKQQLEEKNKLISEDKAYESFLDVSNKLNKAEAALTAPKSNSIDKKEIEKQINWLTENGSNRIDMMRIHLLKERLGIGVNLIQSKEKEVKK